MPAEEATFDDMRDILKSAPGPDELARAAATVRNAELTKPGGSLGRLEAVAGWFAAC